MADCIRFRNHEYLNDQLDTNPIKIQKKIIGNHFTLNKWKIKPCLIRETRKNVFLLLYGCHEINNSKINSNLIKLNEWSGELKADRSKTFPIKILLITINRKDWWLIQVEAKLKCERSLKVWVKEIESLRARWGELKSWNNHFYLLFYDKLLKPSKTCKTLNLLSFNYYSSYIGLTWNYGIYDERTDCHVDVWKMI